jgi:hypothetical protein
MFIILLKQLLNLDLYGQINLFFYLKSILNNGEKLLD